MYPSVFVIFHIFLPLWPLLHEIEQPASSRVPKENLASCHIPEEHKSLSFHYFGLFNKFELNFENNWGQKFKYTWHKTS
jgi:hypothetical protein